MTRGIRVAAAQRRGGRHVEAVCSPCLRSELLAAFGCDPPASKPCASSADCSGGTLLHLVESGVCSPPPGCDRPDVACPAGLLRHLPAQAVRASAGRTPTAEPPRSTCTGCDCLALGPGDPEPKCPTPGVQCFADPCLNKAAVCAAGRCTIASALVQCRLRPSTRLHRLRSRWWLRGRGGLRARLQSERRLPVDNLHAYDGLCQVMGCI